ncbi:MAG TPA: glycosyltransferase family 2 protein [Acidimicrobiales bacterium]|nr:glycosyltransferase family 2 protein [Acidimicrobiales bacterium]
MGEPYLSVLIPAYNEGSTLEHVIDAVLKVPEDLEVILIDDGSKDDTWRVMESRADGNRVRAIRHDVNRGKGAAIRTGLTHARGEIMLVQDADLEYSPDEYGALLEPFKTGRATVVYGSRSFSSHAAFSYWYVMGNRLVTLFTNVLYNCYLSDMETCYKVMPLKVARSLDLKARGFELEPEITAKLLRQGHRIYEVPVSYTARSREEGKKLTARDGVKAIITLLRYRSWKPTRPPE